MITGGFLEMIVARLHSSKSLSSLKLPAKESFECAKIVLDSSKSASLFLPVIFHRC